MECSCSYVTCVTGTAQCKLNYLVYLYRAAITLQNFMSKYANTNHHASISKHACCCNLIIRYFATVVLQSQTLVQTGFARL